MPKTCRAWLNRGCLHGVYAKSLHPCSSVAKRVVTKGDSFTLACLRPESTFTHSTTDSIRIRVIIAIRVPVTIASRRSLKIKRRLAPGLETSCAACDKNPMRGLGSKILCHEAVNVTVTSQTRGTRVTAAYRDFPILTMMVVATHKATVASN